jgi:hypothetical protein
VVLALPDPARDERAYGLVFPQDPEAATALGRKLPHYGRYGYLLFDGERNVDKGSWVVRSSPLRFVAGGM